MLAHVGPTLALCWPKLALSCLYVGPMLALSCLPKAVPRQAKRWCRNSIFGSLNTRLQGRQGNTSHRRLEGPWKSLVEQGGAWFRNTGSPAGFKPKAVPRQAKRWCRNIIFGTATYKTRRQTTQHKPQKT